MKATTFNPFTLRVVSSLMVATPRMWTATLAERQDEVKYGPLTYARAYGILRGSITNHVRAMRDLERWRDDPTVSRATRAFRAKAYPNLVWCLEEVIPRIRSVEEYLDGDRHRTGQLLMVENVELAGGFHVLAEWDDETERLIYFLGPKWTRKRIRAMLTLLQMKAGQIYGRVPRSVIVVDIARREIVELKDLDPDEVNSAKKTVRALKSWFRRRAS